jgi:predicted dehydrogenase
MRSYKVAIVGTGGIAAVHASNVERTGGRAELVAACDVDAARLESFCNEHDIPGRFRSLTELLAERASRTSCTCARRP